MNSSKRVIFKKNLKACFDAINKRLTSERAIGRCDRCEHHASGTLFYHYNVPVLLLCDGCNATA